MVALKRPSTQWRIAGKIEKGGDARVVLSGAQGQSIIPVKKLHVFDKPFMIVPELATDTHL